MDSDSMLLTMANPDPEIHPDLAKEGGAKIVGTGRSDFPNQVNNVLAFPGVFRGALDVRASDINEEMKIAAAYAIAGLIPDEELSETNILPAALDERVAPAVAAAVAKAARESGERSDIGGSMREISASLISQTVEELCIRACYHLGGRCRKVA